MTLGPGPPKSPLFRVPKAVGMPSAVSPNTAPEVATGVNHASLGDECLWDRSSFHRTRAPILCSLVFRPTAMPDDSQNEITFVYEDSDEVRTLTATGAHGGPTPDGASVVANLYVERASIPHHVSHQIDETGQVNLTERSEQVTRGELTREVTGLRHDSGARLTTRTMAATQRQAGHGATSANLRVGRRPPRGPIHLYDPDPHGAMSVVWCAPRGFRRLLPGLWRDAYRGSALGSNGRALV